MKKIVVLKKAVFPSSIYWRNTIFFFFFFLSHALNLSFSRKDVDGGLFTPKKLQLFTELRWTLFLPCWEVVL